MTSSERSIRLDIEVPATPEQAWEAVASGPGITAWYVPALVDERVGGKVTLSFGPGMDAAGQVTAFEPPRRFAYAASGEAGGQTFDWTIHERAGGGSLVRLVNGGFGEGPESDGEVAAMTAGWGLFLDNLRLHLTHFAREPCTPVLAGARAPGPRDRAWRELTEALGLPADAASGDRVATSGPDTPRLAGTVERAAEGMLTLLLDPPARGVAFVAAEGGPDTVALSVWLYLRGEPRPDAAAWPGWLAARFPTT